MRAGAACTARGLCRTEGRVVPPGAGQHAPARTAAAVRRVHSPQVQLDAQRTKRTSFSKPGPRGCRNLGLQVSLLGFTLKRIALLKTLFRVSYDRDSSHGSAQLGSHGRGGSRCRTCGQQSGLLRQLLCCLTTINKPSAKSQEKPANL